MHCTATGGDRQCNTRQPPTALVRVTRLIMSVRGQTAPKKSQQTAAHVSTTNCRACDLHLSLCAGPQVLETPITCMNTFLTRCSDLDINTMMERVSVGAWEGVC